MSEEIIAPGALAGQVGKTVPVTFGIGGPVIGSGYVTDEGVVAMSIVADGIIEVAGTGEQPVEVRVDLMRPAPGVVRCSICFRAREVADLFVDPANGRPWDVCGDGTCAAEAGLT